MYNNVIETRLNRPIKVDTRRFPWFASVKLCYPPLRTERSKQILLFDTELPPWLGHAECEPEK